MLKRCSVEYEKSMVDIRQPTISPHSLAGAKGYLLRKAGSPPKTSFLERFLPLWAQEIEPIPPAVNANTVVYDSNFHQVIARRFILFLQIVVSQLLMQWRG
jgi:hypothetical protein